MKKVLKISKVLVAGLLAFGLVACGKSEEVVMLEENISMIGVVDLEKEEMIISAEQIYDSLGDKDKEDVENYGLLVSARQDFDNIGKDYSDEDKLFARASIAVQNVIENKEAIVIPSIIANNEEIEYVEIITSVEKFEDNITEIVEQTFIVTEDENTIINIIAEDEANIFDVLIDYETGLFVITEAVSKELAFGETLFETTEPIYDKVGLLIERYSDTKDKDFIGLEEQVIEQFNDKAKKVELKKQTVSALIDFYARAMVMEDLQVDAQDAIIAKNYGEALAMYNETIFLCEEVLALDFSEISLELETLKNNMAELMIESSNNSIIKIDAIKQLQFDELKKLHEKALDQMRESLNNFEKFYELYESDFRGKLV